MTAFVKKRYFEDIAVILTSRAQVNERKDLLGHDARGVSGAYADDCEWGVRSTVAAPSLSPRFVRKPVTLPIVFEDLITP